MNTATKNTFTDRQIKTVVARYFPKESVTKIQPLPGGTFNTLYRIWGTGELEKSVVLKTEPVFSEAVSEHERNAVRTEACFYQMVEGLGLPIPHIYACDFSRELLPCDYFLMEYMEGRSWYELMRVHSPAVMEQLGQCTAKIHSVKGDWFGSILPSSREQFQSWGDAFVFMVESVLEEIKRQRIRLPCEQILAVVKARRGLLDAVRRPVLVNFDMWAGNVFLKRRQEYSISAIIDFERCFFGDPFASFASAFLIYDDVEKEEDFIAGYNAVSREPLQFTQDDRERMILYQMLVFLRSYCETRRYGFWMRSLERIGIRAIISDCMWRLGQAEKSRKPAKQYHFTGGLESGNKKEKLS